MENLRYIIKPDFTYNSKFPFVSVEQVYNTILIDNSDNNIPQITGKKITLVNKRNNKEFHQSIVFDSGNISIGQTEHTYYTIAPGLKIKNPISEKDNYQLKIDDNIYPLSLLMKPKSHKLIIGLLILSDNYYTNFSINDKIELYCDNNLITGNIKNIKNKFNYYSGNRINTILDIISSNNTDILYALNNNNLYDKILVRSSDTTLLKQKGSIRLYCRNSDKYRLGIKCAGVDNSYYAEYNMIDRLVIDNLSVGKYVLTIHNNFGQIEHIDFDIPYFSENVSDLRKGLPLFRPSNNLIKS